MTTPNPENINMNQTPQNNDHLNETMLYQVPGPHEFQGISCDYIIVPEADIEDAKAQGWHLSLPAAKAAREAARLDAAMAVIAQRPDPKPIETAPVIEPVAVLVVDPAPAAPAPAPAAVELTHQEQTAPVTYDEMKTKATQLGLEYPGNISKAALLAMITAKLAEQV